MSLSMHYFSILLASSSLKHKNSSNVSLALTAPATSPFVFTSRKKNCWRARPRGFLHLFQIEQWLFPNRNNSKLISQREHSSGEFADLFLHLPSSPWRATLTLTRPSRLMSVKQVPGADESNASRRGSKVSIETVPRHVVLPLLTQTRYYPGGTVSCKRKSSLQQAPHDEQ